MGGLNRERTAEPNFYNSLRRGRGDATPLSADHKRTGNHTQSIPSLLLKVMTAHNSSTSPVSFFLDIQQPEYAILS